MSELGKDDNKVILIQGATNKEVHYIIEVLKDKKCTQIAGYEFYEGTIDNIKVVVSETLVGTINATIATIIGIKEFKPSMVINQGIAGAHRKDLHIGDIVLGEKCCNINYYKMPLKGEGEGSNPFEWEMNKRVREPELADSKLVDTVEKILSETTNNKIYRGILGSGDVFNREYDRIVWINKTFNNSCEDMESIGTYTVCNKFGVPCIGIRIISNNELNKEEIDKSMALELQKIIIGILNKLQELS